MKDRNEGSTNFVQLGLWMPSCLRTIRLVPAQPSHRPASSSPPLDLSLPRSVFLCLRRICCSVFSSLCLASTTFALPRAVYFIIDRFCAAFVPPSNADAPRAVASLRFCLLARSLCTSNALRTPSYIHHTYVLLLLLLLMVSWSCLLVRRANVRLYEVRQSLESSLIESNRLGPMRCDALAQPANPQRRRQRVHD
jgi:hypothetical protein